MREVDHDAPQAQWRMVHRLADAATPTVARALDRAWQSMAADLNMAEVSRALKAGDANAAVEAVDMDVLARALQDTVWPHIQKVYVRAGTIVARQVRSGKLAKAAGTVAARLIFDEANPHAKDWAEQSSSKLVVEITEETREAIRRTVTKGYTESASPDKTAKALRDTIGLNTRQQEALQRKVEKWQADGLSSTLIEKRREFEYKKALRYRSMNIARTETVGASNSGQLEAWRQGRSDGLIDEGLVKEWIVTPDDRLCPVCEPMGGQQVPLDAVFSSGQLNPPLHPSCRCAVGLVSPKPDPNAVQAEVTAQTVIDKFRAVQQELKQAEADYTTQFIASRDAKDKLAVEYMKLDLDTRAYSKDPKVVAMRDELSKMRNSHQDLINNQVRVKEAIVKKAQEALFDPLPGKLNVVYSGGGKDAATGKLVSKAVKQKVEDAAEFLGKIIGEKAVNDVKRITVVYDSSVKREFFRGSTNSIHINPSTSMETIVHEMGHQVERSQYRGVYQPAYKFWSQRTAGEETRPLNQFAGFLRYDAKEVGRKDKFMDPYMGKVYTGQSSTELISMGVQKMWEDPLSLLKDEGYFNMLLSTLRGLK